MGHLVGQRLQQPRYLVRLDKALPRMLREFLDASCSICTVRIVTNQRLSRKGNAIVEWLDSQRVRSWPARSEPSIVTTYKQCLRRPAESFGGKRLSEIALFHVEAHKQRRTQAGTCQRL